METQTITLSPGPTAGSSTQAGSKRTLHRSGSDQSIAPEAGKAFAAIEPLHGIVEGEPAANRTEVDPARAARFLEGWARKLGAVDIGVTRLRPEHVYAVGGRRDRYGRPLVHELPLAIAFTVEMDREMVAAAPRAPTVMESARQYHRAAGIDGVARWRIDQQACYTYWCSAGTDCARCVAACPFSHPDNLLHRLIRAGVRRSAPFRRAALRLDDLFYGRRPRPAPVPAWMNREGDSA